MLHPHRLHLLASIQGLFNNSLPPLSPWTLPNHQLLHLFLSQNDSHPTTTFHHSHLLLYLSLSLSDFWCHPPPSNLSFTSPYPTLIIARSPNHHRHYPSSSSTSLFPSPTMATTFSLPLPSFVFFLNVRDLIKSLYHKLTLIQYLNHITLF